MFQSAADVEENRSQYSLPLPMTPKGPDLIKQINLLTVKGPSHQIRFPKSGSIE
jgi:hypothetical protein